MRARLLNTSPRAVVAPRPAPGAGAARRLTAAVLSLLAALACSAAIGACGGGGGDPPSAGSLLKQTFASHRPIESGRISLSFSLAPAGAGATGAGATGAGAPASLQVEGPFQSAGPSQLPHFDLQVGLSAGGVIAGAQPLHLGAVSTGGKLFIVLGGTPFEAPASTVRALQQGYSQAAAAGGHSTFAALGIDPGAWLTHPAVAGSANLAGERTIHIVAGLDAQHFFADAERLSGAAGALPAGASGLLDPSAVSAFQGALRSARVDVYTGSSDHLLRRLTVQVELAPTAADRGALGGLSGATMTLALQFAQLNRPQTITAPSGTQPISQLLPVLERLGLVGGARAGG